MIRARKTSRVFWWPLAALALAATSSGAESLTPEQALTLAKAGSPDLRAALFDIAATRASVLAEDRARQARLSGNVGAEHAERLGASKDQLSRSGDDALYADAALVLATDAGTTVQVGADTSLTWGRQNLDPNNQDDTISGPNYALGASVSVRQPLLRGAGTDVVLAPLRRAQAELTAAERARDDAGSALARDVLTAYWELWYAEAALEVERQALDVSQRQVDEIHARANTLGTVPQTDVLRLDSERAARTLRVVNAEGLVATRQVALGRLVNLRPTDAATLHTVPKPTLTVPSGDLAALIARAEATSPALAETAARLEAARASLVVASDQIAPKVDLTASLSAGTLWNEDGRYPGSRPALTAMVGLAWELPFAASSEEAQRDAAVARLEAQQARLDGEVQRLGEQLARLTTQLRTARATAESAAVAAQVARELASKEAQRLTLGTSILTNLITAEQSAREAELQRLRADADRATAALAISHLTGDLLISAIEPAVEPVPTAPPSPPGVVR